MEPIPNGSDPNRMSLLKTQIFPLLEVFEEEHIGFYFRKGNEQAKRQQRILKAVESSNKKCFMGETRPLGE